MYLLRRRGTAAPAPESSRSWERWPVPSEGAALVPLPDGAGLEIRAGRDGRAAAHVVPFVENERNAAALVVDPRASALFVDGASPLRVSVLEERSEIVVAGDRLYFTAREPLSVTPHAGDGGDCALCGDPLEGAQVIRCTGCGAITHEGSISADEERRCFSHHGRCPRCQLTRGDFAWTPAEGD